MIPEFEESGNLPSGIHLTTIEEFKKRFVTNQARQNLFIGLEKLMDDLKNKIGCKTIYIDGSYVTRKESPNDIDVVWDQRGIDIEHVKKVMPILFLMMPPRKEQQQTYSSDIFPAFIVEGASGRMFLDFFQRDKETDLPKGIIQINLDDHDKESKTSNLHQEQNLGVAKGTGEIRKE